MRRRKSGHPTGSKNKTCHNDEMEIKKMDEGERTKCR
jgi:hypothetical protein